jgi:putative endonuclease
MLWRGNFLYIISSMMYYVYLLKDCFGKIYIGYTNNLKRRLIEHARGYSKYLKLRRPVKLIYYEAYLSAEDAKEREKSLKNYGSVLSGLKSRLKNSLEIAQNRKKEKFLKI